MPPPRWFARAPWVAALLGLIVAVFVAFHDVLPADRGLVFRDHTLVFKPLLRAITADLEAGRLPVAPRWSASGVPADQSVASGTYTPGTLLLLLGPFDVVYDLYVVLHFVLLAFGAFALARRLGADVTEAFLAASVAALAGPVLSFENLVVALVSMAWAPWVYWALHRSLTAPGPRSAALLALTFAFHVQGVLPELVLVDALAFAALLAVVRPRLDLRLALTLVGALVLGLALAAPDLLPMLEALGRSRRGHGFTYEEAATWSLAPAQLLELVVPSFWAPPDAPFVNVPSITGTDQPPYLGSLYLGTALSLLALGLGRGRRAWIGGAFAFFFLAALGPATPLHAGLWSLPLLGSARFPVKYLVGAVACLATFAPLALRTARERPVRWLGVALLQAVVLASIYQAAGTRELGEYLEVALAPGLVARPVAGLEPATFPAFVAGLMEGRTALALAFAALSVVLAGVAVARPKLAPVLLAVSITADLTAAAARTVCGTPIATQRPPADVLARTASAEVRVHAPTPGGRSAAITHVEGHTYFEDVYASEGLRGRLFHPGSRRFYDGDLDGQSDPFAPFLYELASRTSGRPGRRIMARAGVGLVTTWKPDLEEERWFSYDVPGGPPEHVYRLPDVRPYVHAYARWAPLSWQSEPPEAIAARLTAADAWDIALVPGGTTSSTVACATTAALAPGALDPGAHAIAVDVDAGCPSLVAVLERHMPGWRAELDGQPVATAKADLGALGAFVPAGQHHLVFRYVSPLTVRGLQLAAVALACALGLLAFGAARPGEAWYGRGAWRGRPTNAP